jgi:putative sigma-54 modulation protein
MDFQVKGRNIEVSDSIRSYAAGKLAKLERHLRDPLRVELELSVERNPSISANHVAEATVWTRGPVLRAHEASADMKASIDQLVDKLERQVERYRHKRRRKNSRGDGPPPPEEPSTEPRIVKTKQFAIKPMSAEEAVLQLELIGHDFFVFRNADTDEVNVVYRRRDGGYGLIEPQ